MRLRVEADDAAVLAAIERRLGRFASALEDEPDVTFRLAPSVPPPPVGGRGDMRAVYDSPLGGVVYAEASDQLLIDAGPGVGVVVDARAGRVCAAAGDAAQRWLLSHPLLTLPLIELLKRHGLYSLHAAGLALGGRGLLIAGTSGAGKSTLSVALLRAGFQFLGDDLLFLLPGPDGIGALAFPDEIDLTDDTLRLFPELDWLRQQPRPPGWPKWSARAEELYPTCTVLRCAPAALLFPRVGPSHQSVLTPLEPDQALIELAPNVLLTEAASTAAHFAALAELVRTCPAYRLETGRDFEALADLLRTLLGTDCQASRSGRTT